MKKLNLYQIEERLLNLNLKIFRPQDLQVLFGANRRAVQGFLTYNLKRGAFVHFKRGLYALKKNLPHDFVLANSLYSPSYISLDSALSYYNLIPETVYAITSVTSKPTREFEVDNRLFDYRKIKKEAYTGYIPKNLNGEIVYLATPEKAVADFLYFVFLGKRAFNERLKLEKINKQKLKSYLKLLRSKNLFIWSKKALEKIWLKNKF
jgi:predicted transcriptional regulator of viral defense system